MLLNIRREEYKYYIGLNQVTFLEKALESLMNLDEACNNFHKSYSVKSLYFDTPDDKDLNEKLDGIIDREKFRIRTYPSSNSLPMYKLEQKLKFDTVIQKVSLKIEPEHVKNIQDGNYKDMKGLNNDFADYCYNRFSSLGYRPKVIVEYDRTAFTLPFCNIRITIDKNLSTYNGGTDLMNASLSKTPIFLDGMAILEVKFEKYLPSYIQNALSKFNLKRCAISKFVHSRVHTIGNSWSDHLVRPF